MLLGLAYFLGGSFLPFLCIFAGALLVLWGHFPNLLATEREEQIVASVPYQRTESRLKWATGIALVLALSGSGSLLFRRLSPQKSDISRIVRDAIFDSLHKPDIGPTREPPTPAPVQPLPPKSEAEPKPTFTHVLGDFVVIAGGREYKPGAITVFGEQQPAISAYVDQGNLFVDARLYSTVGGSALKLVKNKLMAMPPQWDTNFDNSAIEVVDEQGRPRFQLIYHDPHTVFLRGIFQFEDRVVVLEEKKVMSHTL